MAVLQLPLCPPSLKPIQHYLKTASEHETRDPVITYWCRLYSMQAALKIDRKSDDARKILTGLIEWLEKEKKVLSDNEAVTNDIAAQAHIENYALKLFMWADEQDRAGVFNKNVVKAFYTAGMLMDVLTTFGEPNEEIVANCKYAKWKAAYIHNCLKNGEIPVPGPMGWEKENNEDDWKNEEGNSRGAEGYSGGNLGFNIPAPQNTEWKPENNLHLETFPSVPPEISPNIPRTPTPPSDHNPNFNMDLGQGTSSMIGTNSSSTKPDPAVITKAQKYCKFAASALNYDDVSEAINNLQKALRLLQTGQDT